MSRTPLKTACFVILAAVLLTLPAPRAAQADDTKISGPADVARQFLSAFEKKDWATVRTLFAPNAVVTTVSLAKKGPPQTAYLTTDQWLTQIEKELAPLTDIKVELLDTSTLSFDQGANVSVRFRATGKAGPASFSNNGVDSYSLIPVDGTWRILRYGTFELLEIH